LLSKLCLIFCKNWRRLCTLKKCKIWTSILHKKHCWNKKWVWFSCRRNIYFTNPSSTGVPNFTLSNNMGLSYFRYSWAPFVKTDDDCVHWKNAKYGHQFCIKNTRNKTVHNNIFYLSGTRTRTAKWPESQQRTLIGRHIEVWLLRFFTN
jgi:hypothetical protein